MAQTAVDVVVRVKDLAALDRLKKSLAGVEGATLKGEKGIKRFENSLKRLQGVIGGLAIGDQLRRAFGAAANFSATEQRLNNIGKQYSQLAGIQELAAASAEKFGVSTAQAASDLADLGSRLGSSGANLKDLSDIYEGFNTLLAVNAVNSQSAASAQLQLNQALGSGRLAGEEFNAINEATPQLLDEVARVLGVARGELKQLASDGEISSQVLVEALRNVAADGSEALADFFKTPAGQLKLFDKAVQDFQVTIGQKLLPVFTPVIEALSTLLQLFGQLPGPIQTTAVAVAALGASIALVGGPVTLIAAGLIGLTLVIKKFADENQAFADALSGAWDGFVDFLGRAIAGTSAAVKSLSESFAGAVRLWKERIQSFLDFWAGIGDTLVNVWNSAIDILVSAWQAFVDFITKTFNFIYEGWKKFTGVFGEAWEIVVGFLGKAFEGFANYLGSAFSAISRSFNGLLESMNINFADTIRNMINNASPLLMLFKAIGVDIGDAIVSGVEAGMQAFSSFEAPAAPSFDAPRGGSGLGASGGAGAGAGAGGKKKGAGRAGKADPGADGEEIIKQLSRQIALTEAKDKLEKSLLESQYEYIDNLEAASEIQDASLRTLAEQAAAQLLGLQRQEAYTEYVQEGLKAQMALQDAQEAALAPLTDRQKYLQDALKYGREEADIRQQIYNITKDQPELDKGRVEQLVRGNKALEDSLEKTEQLQAQYEQLEEAIYQRIGAAIEDSLVQGIEAAISGAKELDEVLQGIASTLLKDIGRMLIRSGISGLGAALDIPGFASGGMPEPNSVSIVGEQGPELLLTGNYASRVLPNDVFEDTKDALISSGQVVDAETDEALQANNTAISNTTYGGSNSASSAFAVNNNTLQSQQMMAAAAADREAAQQALTTPNKISFTYESTVINEQQYVSTEQHQKGLAMAAKKGRDMAIASLKNSVRARKEVGMA